MIFDIKTVSGWNSDEFSRAVWEYINEMQEQGLRCEVQYAVNGSQYGSPRHSAMIISHQRPQRPCLPEVVVNEQ